MEPPFDKLDGVLSTTSGYTGGHIEKPTYKTIYTGQTGLYEAIAVAYNPDIVSYSDLLEVFWKNNDPLDAAGQFCDKGSQYRAAFFYRNGKEKQQALASKDKLQQQFWADKR